MLVRRVVVSASATVPHPTVPFANVKPGVELHADVQEGEDHAKVAAVLQAECDLLVARHAETLKLRMEQMSKRKDAFT